MGIEELKNIKTQLVSCVQGQMSNLHQADAKELGEAIDMIKDLSEAVYYCTITESMEKVDQNKENVNNINYYTTYPDYRGVQRSNGYMYYPSGNGTNNSTSNNGNGSNTTTAYYTEMPYGMARDPREGRAAIRRRMYMEGKQSHRDTNSQLKELEAYLQELSTDITEMIKDASPEEKATLHQKMTTLASKIG